MQRKLDRDAFSQLIAELVEQLDTQNFQFPIIFLSESFFDGSPDLKEIAFVHKAPEFYIFLTEDRDFVGIGIIFENKDTEWPARPRSTVLNSGHQPSYYNFFVFDA